MAHCAQEDQVPWHRVVGSDGTLRVARYSPVLAQEQRRRLESEGVVFDSRGRVPISYFW
jgi:methylated-DNA-protein-cysteine methyltransferase related protein